MYHSFANNRSEYIINEHVFVVNIFFEIFFEKLIKWDGDNFINKKIFFKIYKKVLSL